MDMDNEVAQLMTVRSTEDIPAFCKPILSIKCVVLLSTCIICISVCGMCIYMIISQKGDNTVYIGILCSILSAMFGVLLGRSKKIMNE